MTSPLVVRAAALAALSLASTSSALGQGVADVWIGTGRSRLSRSVTSRGIYTCSLDAKTGRLGAPRLAAEIETPGFLALHPRGHTLYAVGRVAKAHVVAAYEIERDENARPKLRLRNVQPIGDGGAAHVAVHPSGRMLMTAQYGGGSVACFALDAYGRLEKRTLLVEHEGASGVVARRQKKPHPHWVGFSPGGKFAFVPDLGCDAVLCYAVDLEAARIKKHGRVPMPPGSGPRHMVFHPRFPRAYVLGELTLAITVCDVDAESALLKPAITVPTLLPEEVAGLRFMSASEIRVHPNGRFVYSANRGHDSISVFEVEKEGRGLRRVDLEHCRGATPRNFGISPDGRWLLAAGQDSHTLASFAIDSETGALHFARSIEHVPAPICVLVQARD